MGLTRHLRRIMGSKPSPRDGIVIRLEPEADSAWTTVFRNHGPEPLLDVQLMIMEGGIPTFGELGSTLGTGRTLARFDPGEEVRLGHFVPVPGGDYLDLPWSAMVLKDRLVLASLSVRREDFNRLGTLCSVGAPCGFILPGG